MTLDRFMGMDQHLPKDIQLLVSAYLCGLIWFVQLVHYPSFRYVGEAVFVQFHSFHTRAITVVVAPAMILELGLALMLWSLNPTNWLFQLSLILVILIWLSTFLISVPIHRKLALNKDSALIERLILTNWPRTILWTLLLGGRFLLM